jgi:hypothetical protein
MTMRQFWRALGGACLLAIHAHSFAADSVAPGGDKMMALLLRPSGWKVDWSGPGVSGLAEIIFERRAEKVVAKINLVTPYAISCEKPATIASNAVTLDGCREPSFTLFFDPSDLEYPFKGRSPRGYEWKLRAK